MTKRDLYNAVRAQALAADAKAEQLRATLKSQQQQVEYWQEQAKCARGLLHRLDAEAHDEESLHGKA